MSGSVVSLTLLHIHEAGHAVAMAALELPLPPDVLVIAGAHGHVGRPASARVTFDELVAGYAGAAAELTFGSSRDVWRDASADLAFVARWSAILARDTGEAPARLAKHAWEKARELVRARRDAIACFAEAIARNGERLGGVEVERALAIAAKRRVWTRRGEEDAAIARRARFETVASPGMSRVALADAWEESGRAADLAAFALPSMTDAALGEAVRSTAILPPPAWLQALGASR